MNFLFNILSVLFILLLIKNVLFWIYLWQLKEYRLDRLIVHLKETIQGKKIIFSPLSIVKILLIILYGVVISNDKFIFFYQLAVALVIFFQFFSNFRGFPHSIKRPVFTLKAIIIIFLSFSTMFLLFFLPFVDRFVWILVIDKLTPLFIAFYIFIFSFPTNIYKDLQVEKAVKKIKEQKKLLVIGITGSYGKSSTKEYVAQVLSNKFKVLKTEGTNNTLIGIAKTIISGLNRNTQVFVVEMGAYKRGEIAELCQMVNPKIGVLTSVNNQHLSLFGNSDNILKTKYELIESLPKNGLALFNSNNKNTLKLYLKTKKKKVLYHSIKREKIIDFRKQAKFDISATNIKLNKDSIEFDVLIKNKIIHVKTCLIGAHCVENILPAIYIADYLGIEEDDIKKAVLNLLPIQKTMNRYKLNSGLTLIDDTFNANPQSVLAALDYMSIYKGKKVLVLQPLIELGYDAKNQHQEIGKEVAKACDYLFLTNNNFYEQIIIGTRLVNSNCNVKIASSSEIAEFIKEKMKKNDIVVFEGKESSSALYKLLNK